MHNILGSETDIYILKNPTNKHIRYAKDRRVLMFRYIYLMQKYAYLTNHTFSDAPHFDHQFQSVD